MRMHTTQVTTCTCGLAAHTLTTVLVEMLVELIATGTSRIGNAQKTHARMACLTER